jgi:hypothetical protein
MCEKWNKFETTGSIYDYLEYKSCSSLHQDLTSRQKGGKEGAAGESRVDGDRVVGYADRGV